METVRRLVLEITRHIGVALNEIQDEELEDLVTAILNSKRIFVYGVGRSGFVAKAFATRLSNLRLEVFVAGETVIPAIRENDLFVAVSGSGETNSIVRCADAARQQGARIIGITSHRNSSLAQIANGVLVVKGRTKHDVRLTDDVAAKLRGISAPLPPLGTLFEDTALIVLDGVIAALMERMGATEVDLAVTHSNIE